MASVKNVVKKTFSPEAKVVGSVVVGMAVFGLIKTYVDKINSTNPVARFAKNATNLG